MILKLLSLIVSINLTLIYGQFHYDIKKFEVPADHFNYVNDLKFEIRYLYNDSFVPKDDDSRANAPIFFYTGNEGDVELFAQNTGFMWKIAQELKGFVVFAEHRYYGKSVPSFCNGALNTTNCIQFLTVEQALEDFSNLISVLSGGGRKPVIAFGGSYGGMLSAWLRMKYPHLVTGALAASAPIWQFNGLTPCDLYSKITTTIFTSSLSSNCSLNIKNSWSTINKFFSAEDSKKQLNEIFNFCTPLSKNEDKDKLFDYLKDLYSNLAMANYPYYNEFLAPLPAYPVRQFCLYLKEEYKDLDLLKALKNGVNVYSNFTGKAKCLDYSSAYDPKLGGTTWEIQTCNQIVMPMCSDANNTMFLPEEWDFKAYSERCYNKYKLRPQLNEMVIRYGGKNIRFSSNIIFSNGLLDPWSGGGVLQSVNNNIYVIIIPEGAHHIDLRADNIADPESVTTARKRETKIIINWINEFYQIKAATKNNASK